jgi:enterochelin esterase-like enzyme
VGVVLGQEPEFPLTADSKPQPGVAKGTMVKGEYVAKEGSVFPGTVREYQLYLPAGFDKTKPAAFMVFQDGVIYQAPVVFDNLIAKGDIPPLVGVFIKPGVVPAANENALPRFNRSFEYDSVTPTYSRFLIEEFLPAVEVKHGITFSTNPNEAAISGNSSGGICAFMVAWHRPDRFRRVFTGVGTYVGIHGADQLPVWVRKFEPKPIRVFLQSGTGDNNLYCGDWWMANQMMERSLTWAGYEVNHAWGEGGHNQKHASQVFPEAMRWLWREWKTEMEVKANVKGESKWKGYEVMGEGAWEEVIRFRKHDAYVIASNATGRVLTGGESGEIYELSSEEVIYRPFSVKGFVTDIDALTDGAWLVTGSIDYSPKLYLINALNELTDTDDLESRWCERVSVNVDQMVFVGTGMGPSISIGPPFEPLPDRKVKLIEIIFPIVSCLLPDQSQLYGRSNDMIYVTQLQEAEGEMNNSSWQEYGQLLEGERYFRFATKDEVTGGLCVDTNGWLYVATSLGIQVLDQAGRVNFIIPTPKQAHDVCFGGKDLSELFIACGDTVYKRVTKAKGVVSGQMAPIKPAAPKL